MNLAWPWVLLLLPLPWLIWHGLPDVGSRVALRVPDLAAFTGSPAGAASVTPPTWLLFAWLLLLLAAARPQWIDADAPVRVSGRDLLLAIDISASMGQTDTAADAGRTSRLARAVALADRFVARRAGDRIGLVVFGDRARLHTPLTYDHRALREGLAALEVGLLGRETALGDARLRSGASNARAVILLTDGVQTTGEMDPGQAAWLAAREGVRVHVAGIGSLGSTEATPSDYDAPQLEAMAVRTGGLFRHAATDSSLADFFAAVDEIEPSLREVRELRSTREFYPWPLVLALAVMIAWRVRTRGALA
jgi:Ca-activated chloride channel family protein